MPQNKQLKYDKAYLRMAGEWAKLSYCDRRQVGAIIVKDRMIILMDIMELQRALKIFVRMMKVILNGMYFMLKQMLFLKLQLQHSLAKVLHFILLYRPVKIVVN